MSDQTATWMQCVTPFPGNFAGIQEPFELAFLNARGNPDLALFARTTPDFEHEIFLISPAVVRRHPGFLRLGDWEPCEDPHAHGWALLVGVADAHERFGLRRPD